MLPLSRRDLPSKGNVPAVAKMFIKAEKLDRACADAPKFPIWANITWMLRRGYILRK